MSEVIHMRLQDVVLTGGGGGGSDAIWLPSVDASGNISWTRSTSTTAPETRNIKGPAGADGQNGQDGAPGSDGSDGADGIGIASIEKTSTSGLVDTYTITFTDGNTTTFTVTNGQNGTNGTNGQNGTDGLGIKSVAINGSNHLIVTFDDDTTEDAGEIPSGTTVVANPTLAGTEADLTGLQVGNTKYKVPTGGGGGSASWGSITGTLANQTDLKSALDAKFDADNFTVSGGGPNLVDLANSHANWKPGMASGTKYTPGESATNYYTTNLWSYTSNEKLKWYIDSFPSYIRYVLYDSSYNYMTAGSISSSSTDPDGNYVFQASKTGCAYCCFVMYSSQAHFDTIVVKRYDEWGAPKVVVNDLYFSDNNVAMAKERLGISSDILSGKKWAVAGDSFTAGDFTGVTEPTIPSGKYAGEKAVYPYLIGNRCNVTIQNLSKGGRTLALPSGEGSSYNSFVNYYQNVAADADYLTIYFGINDSHQSIPIGTITDSTTDSFYGAWNVILSWFITNRPNLHIGIIVSNGCDSDDYRTATIAIAQKYGIPYIDMNGDSRTPCMIRSTNASIDSTIRSQRTTNWRVSANNQHPNADCHAFEATFIEAFLKTL